MREVRLDRADPHEQRRGYLLVAHSVGRELRDPRLGVCQLIPARPPAADPRQLGPRLVRPQPRAQLIEDRHRLLKRLPRRLLLQRLPARLLSSGLSDPTQTIWADAIETLIALGEVEQARGYLDTYEQNSRRVESGWALACAARCRGLLAAAEGNVEPAFEAFEASLLELDRTPYVFERGRTLLSLGVVRRQAMQKKAAREALEQALAVFEELDARLWADKARQELARIGGRRAGGDELTVSESRVAELAAAGRSNKEIAAELFMGVSTVEAHLSHVYRKLGIRSRAGLGGRLATAGVAAPKSVDEAGQS